MTAEQYLQNLRSLEGRLRSLEHEQEMIRADICALRSIDYERDRVSGGAHFGIEARVAKLIACGERATREWDQLVSLREEARALINKVPELAYQTILIERYVNVRTWGGVAKVVGYSSRQAQRVHSKAIEGFTRVFRGQEKLSQNVTKRRLMSFA